MPRLAIFPMSVKSEASLFYYMERSFRVDSVNKKKKVKGGAWSSISLGHDAMSPCVMQCFNTAEAAGRPHSQPQP